MPRFAPAIAVLLACAPLAALPVHATDVPAAAPVTVDPFEDIYAAIQESADMERQLDQLSATIAEQIASADTSLAIAEARYPGLSKAMVAGFRPVLAGYSARVRESFRPRMIAVFRDKLSASEARDVAAFYRSPMGKRLLGGVVESFDAKATITSALKDKEVSAAAVQADTDAAVRGPICRCACWNRVKRWAAITGGAGLRPTSPLRAPTCWHRCARPAGTRAMTCAFRPMPALFRRATTRCRPRISTPDCGANCLLAQSAPAPWSKRWSREASSWPVARPFAPAR